MSQYQECMAKAMRGFPKGLSREERGKLFCIDAKLCSGKFNNRGDAERDCKEHPAAPRSTSGGRAGRKGIDTEAIANCLLPKLTNGTTVSVPILAGWIRQCSGGKGGNRTRKPQSMKRFMKHCMAEEGLDGDVRLNPQSGRVIKACETKWKEAQTV